MDDRDDTPTEPPASEAEAMLRISWQADDADEARAMVELIKAWKAITLEQRVLVSAICREFWKMG